MNTRLRTEIERIVERLEGVQTDAIASCIKNHGEENHAYIRGFISGAVENYAQQLKELIPSP